MTTLSLFDAAREAPDAPAVLDGERTWTFRELAEAALPLAGGLERVRPATLRLTPRPELPSLLWLYAAFATGTPVLTLHARATPAERARASALAAATPARLVDPPAPDADCFDPTQSPPVADETALVYIPTSGSTGSPRLVELSRRAVLASARASAQNLGWEPEDRWLLCLPLAHTGGLSIVVRCLLARKPLVLFDPGETGALERIGELARAAAQASLLSLVPSLLEALLDAGFLPGPRLRAVLVGGSGCSPALARRAHAARIPLLTSYGLTETASQVVTRRYGERFEPLAERAGCVSSGHALPGVELSQRGELLAVRSPSLFSGYLDESPQILEPGGWLLTRDRVSFGTAGELYVHGRSDDLIVTAGENVDPLEVEAALTELPGVRAACVFGTSSPRFGQIVTALLVTDQPALADAPHLAELLADRLARHKLPRRVLRVESLPHTLAGKLDRHACAECWAQARPDLPEG